MSLKRKPESSEVNSIPEAKRQCHSATVQSSLHKYFQTADSQRGSCSSVPAVHSPESYGIHIYNSGEIEKAKGLEKDYQMFWNTKAAELCSDKSTRSKLGDKVAIQGAINASWILHKTNLLKLKAEELCLKARDVYPEDVERVSMLSGVYKNVDRMVAATATIHVLYAEIADGYPEPSQLALTQDNVAKQLTELKKSQDALTKALGRKETELNMAKHKLQDVRLSAKFPFSAAVF